jgi:hypothetical protein
VKSQGGELFFYFLPFNNCLEKIPVKLFDYSSNSLIFKVNARENFSFMF